MNVGDSMEHAWGSAGRFIAACTVRFAGWDDKERDQPCILVLGAYAQGNLAVLVQGAAGDPVGKLSVNLDGACVLAGDEFVVDNDMHSLGWAAQVLRSCGGAVQDTGRRVAYGHVTDAPVWRLAPAITGQLMDAALRSER